MEQGVAPPRRTSYEVVDGQVVVPDDASGTRRGPAGRHAHRRRRRAGPTSPSGSRGDPRGAGSTVPAGTGRDRAGRVGPRRRPATSRSGRPSSPREASSVERRHSFSAPGTHFPTVRVASQRDGDTDDALRPHPEPRPARSSSDRRVDDRMSHDWQASFITAADHTGEAGAAGPVPAPGVHRRRRARAGHAARDRARAWSRPTSTARSSATRCWRPGGRPTATGWRSAATTSPTSSSPAPTPSARSSARAGPSAASAGTSAARSGPTGRRRFLQLELDYGDRIEVRRLRRRLAGGHRRGARQRHLRRRDLRRPARARRLGPRRLRRQRLVGASRSSTGTSARW